METDTGTAQLWILIVQALVALGTLILALATWRLASDTRKSRELSARDYRLSHLPIPLAWFASDPKAEVEQRNNAYESSNLMLARMLKRDPSDVLASIRIENASHGTPAMQISVVMWDSPASLYRTPDLSNRIIYSKHWAQGFFWNNSPVKGKGDIEEVLNQFAGKGRSNSRKLLQRLLAPGKTSKLLVLFTDLEGSRYVIEHLLDGGIGSTGPPSVTSMRIHTTE